MEHRGISSRQAGETILSTTSSIATSADARSTPRRTGTAPCRSVLARASIHTPHARQPLPIGTTDPAGGPRCSAIATARDPRAETGNRVLGIRRSRALPAARTPLRNHTRRARLAPSENGTSALRTAGIGVRWTVKQSAGGVCDRRHCEEGFDGSANVRFRDRGRRIGGGRARRAVVGRSGMQRRVA